MSALTPHIRVLRAEAGALREVSDQYCDSAKGVKSPEGVAISLVLLGISSAKHAAANALEAEDREQEAKVAK